MVLGSGEASDNDVEEIVFSRLSRDRFPTRTVLGRDGLWCPLTRAPVSCWGREPWLKVSRVTGYLDSGVSNVDVLLAGLRNYLLVPE